MERIESQIILEIEVSLDFENEINVMPGHDKIECVSIRIIHM